MSDDPSALPAVLARHTGYLLNRAGAGAQREFGAALQTIGLTLRAWGAMNVIDADGPLTQHALGRALGVDPSTMVATIDELEVAGYVQRRPHPTDRRAHALHVTGAGRDLLGRGRALARTAQRELLAPLSPSEREQLHEMLRRICEHLGPPSPLSPSERRRPGAR
ncbi:MAG: MarR family transcriptional regulator [Solirubrobacterales bacterium]|nr:MarR family transcriptional regulator [Solirubrobacterales bacterium]